SADGFQVEEGDVARFTVTIDHASQLDARIPWTATGLDAADTTDALSGVAVIAPGDLDAVVTIALAEDADTGADERSEALTVTLVAAGATGAAGAGASAAGVIAVDSTANAATQVVTPRLAPTLVWSAEADGGDRDAVTPGLQVNEGDRVTITLSIERAEDLDTAFDTPAAAFTGTATPGVDFSGEGGAADAEFPATTGSFSGAASHSATWLITDDGDPESDETLTLAVPQAVYAGSGVIARGPDLTITIQAGDGRAARTLTVTGPSDLTETDDDVETPEYTVTLSGRTFAVATEVAWTVTHGGTADADFVAVDGRSGRGGSVTFDAGAGDGATETFTLSVAGDDLNEAAERFTVQVTAPDAVTVLGSAHATTIADDDPVTVAITRAAGAGAVGEGSGALEFTVTLAGGTRASGVGAVVPFAVSGLAQAEFDIAAPLVDDGQGGMTAPDATDTTGAVTVAHDSTTGAITVTLLDDDLNEARKTVTVTGAAVGGSGLRLTGTAGTFGGVEYAGSSGNAASVPVDDDDAISVSIANRGADADPDGAAGFQVEEGGNAVFRVSIDHESAADVTVPFTVAGLENADVTGGLAAITTSPLTIMAGRSTADITIPLAEDADTPAGDEMSETVTVTLTMPDAGPPTVAGPAVAAGGGEIAVSSAASEQSAAASIIAKQAEHQFTLTSPAASIAETDSDADAMFTVTRDGPAIVENQDLVVTWSATVAGAANTATAADFSGATTGTVTFTAAETGKQFSIGIAGDNLNEASETFTITFSIAADNAAAFTANGDADLPGAHRVTITDNDPIIATVTAQNGGAVSEGFDAVLEVDLGAVPTGDMRVAYAIVSTADSADVDAIITGAGAELTDSGGGSIAITAAGGAATGAIRIAIAADNLNEGAETFVVTVAASDITGGAHGPVTLTGGDKRIVFTIAASDPLTARIARAGASPPATVNEGASVDFTVTL
ncbi:MAG: hypothetical protein OXU22_01600, partial [Gammaproteobacteria bacterium]|nr:hypothetical protein [Gammaproteobacteria bacterium]